MWKNNSYFEKTHTVRVERVVFPNKYLLPLALNGINEVSLGFYLSHLTSIVHSGMNLVYLALDKFL